MHRYKRLLTRVEMKREFTLFNFTLQAKEFCKKDNATVPYIKNLYWFRTLTQFLETEQADWRYYDMVWVSDLDALEGQCKVFVDRTVETVGCDFLLPTLCEMDEHPSLEVSIE